MPGRFLFAAFCGLLPLLCSGADWKKAVTLRCDFDSPLPPGVKLTGPRRECPGVSGKGLTLNRAAWNSIYHFAGEPGPAGAVAVCPHLSTVRGNGVSFSARGRGGMVLTLRSGAKTETRHVAVDSGAWKRYDELFTVPEELATVTFKPEGIEWKEPQVSGGWSFPAAYAPVRKIVPGTFIEIDPAKGFVDLDRGAFSLWIKTPYLDPKAVMDHIGIFGLDHAEKPLKRHPDQQIGCVTAWNGGRLAAYRMAAEGKGSNSLAVPLSELNFSGDSWHHLVLNWERSGENLTLEFYIDGGKVALRGTKPYGADRKLWRITVGYSDYAHLNGDADELVFFNRPLTADEVSLLFRAGGNWK